MSRFSNILSSYTKERKINISALSAETGIERTLLHKYISGARIPSDLDTVCSLSDRLMLSPDEKKLLCENYKITFIGEENYLRNQKITSIISTLSSIPQPHILWNTEASYERLIPCAVNDRLSVETTIKRMLQDHNTQSLFVIAPPSYNLITNELITLCLNRPDINITHIITFSNRNTPELLNYNLSTFSEILPLIIFCNGYTPLINYCDPTEQTSSVSLLPNLILNDRYAFTFSNCCDKGILHTCSDILNLYKNLSDQLIDKSYGLIQKKITSAPQDSDDIYKICSNFYIKISDKSTSLIFRTNDYFSKILLYEPSLRNIFSEFVKSAIFSEL